MLRRVAAGAALVLAAAVVPAVGLTGASASPISSASSADDSLYRPGGSYDAKAAKVRVSPSKYSLVQVDARRVAAALRNAPVAGKSGSTQSFRVPNPTGGFERFARPAHPGHGVRARRRAPRDRHLVRRLARPPRHDDRPRRDADGLPRLGPRRQRPGLVAGRPGVQRARHDHAPQLLPRGRRPVRGGHSSSSARRAASTTRSRAGRSAAKKGAKVVQQVYRLALTSDPSYADVLRHRERARREGHPDQPGQPDLQRRHGHHDAAGQRDQQAQPRHDGQGAPGPTVRAARTRASTRSPTRTTRRPTSTASSTSATSARSAATAPCSAS